MLVSADIDLPPSLREQLRQEAAFRESLLRFSRDHIAGFQQPVAAAAALISPILVAFTYAVGGFFSLIEVSLIFGCTTLLFLAGAWFAKRQDIAWAYAQGVDRRRQATHDLKLGRGLKLNLVLEAAPLFVEHDTGVIILADTQDGRTLFFDIDGSGTDPRWLQYLNGDLCRYTWSWLRLSGSGSVTRFHAEGAQFTAPVEPLFSDAADAWEAISLALGEPQDGDVIDLPFDEAKQTVWRLL